jgi:hypothetical protein
MPYLFFIIGGVGLSPFWPIVQAPDDRWGWLWSNWWNEDWQGKPKYSDKTCPAPLCPPQIPHDQTRARTPGHRGGKPATNRLSYGAAQAYALTVPSRDKWCDKVTDWIIQLFIYFLSCLCVVDSRKPTGESDLSGYFLFSESIAFDTDGMQFQRGGARASEAQDRETQVKEWRHVGVIKRGDYAVPKTSLNVRHRQVDRYVIIRKLMRYYFQDMMETKIFILEITFNTQGIPLLTLWCNLVHVLDRPY